MNITALRIRNFRGIRSIDLELGPVTVLIGENNSGKTSVLDALKLCLRDLSPRRRFIFDAFDFHLPNATDEPSSAEPIEIEVTFSDSEEAEWDESLVRRLQLARILLVDDDTERNQVRLGVTCEFQEPSLDPVHDWFFLDNSGNRLRPDGGSALNVLKNEIQYYYLTALRDAARHFDAKGPFWRPFLRKSHLSDERKGEIEAKIREVNDLIVKSHSSFEEVQDGLRQLQSMVPMASGDAVSIEAVPNRIFDMLARAQVQLGTPTGATIPLIRHGEGTQSLAVLMLFSAFLQSQAETSTILALEEPEAHLHPSAIQTLGQLICNFSGQKLISTHSGELLAVVDVSDICRLARTKSGISAFRIAPGLLDAEETRKFNYHVRHTNGELLFARCWLLVEGQSESWVYPAAARAIGKELHQHGICVVEFSQSDVGMLVQVANALGIEWYCVGDADGNQNKVEKALNSLDNVNKDNRVIFPYKNIEEHLQGNGYLEEYKRRRQGQKTRAAAAVARRMEENGEAGVTDVIRQVIDRVVSLAQYN